MKKILIILTVFTIFIIYNEVKEDTVVIPDTAIRLRVIPNSNSSLDQNIKSKVKDYLEKNTYPLLANEKDIAKARDLIQSSIPEIDSHISQIFKDNHYDMNYEINYGYNYFPEKTYRGIKYEEGYYESLVISIGDAKGDNWWCVLFPNLCLIDLENTKENEYQFWIAEAINKIF